MLGTEIQRLMFGAAAILMMSSLTALVGGSKNPPQPNTTNINLAVASNFYSQPPSNSAITDLIDEFEAENPNYTVTVTDNGATATLAANIIKRQQSKGRSVFSGRHRNSSRPLPKPF